MKKKLLLLSFVFVSLSAMAQRTPTHPLDINEGKAGNKFFEVFPGWELGTPPEGVSAIDDQFYISRVKPLERIEDDYFQVNPNVSAERKLFLWLPADDPTVKWRALPRYCLEGDNFGMWSYVESHGNWSAPWLRVSAGLSDVTAKNGVTVGCVLNVPWAASVNLASPQNDWAKSIESLMHKQGGEFVHLEKFIKLLKYYGIQAIGFNSEFTVNSQGAKQMKDFFIAAHEKAEELDWTFQVHWYNLMQNGGSVNAGIGDYLGKPNFTWFGTTEGKRVSDMFFLNYNWGNSELEGSVKQAVEMGRSSYDVYAGMDIQGRGFRSKWSALVNNPVSIGFWGAHAQSLLHQAATDAGSADIAIQKSYLLKQELSFSGGNRNPAKLPAIRENATLGNEDLKTFHGLATFISAKSTLHTLPFVTRFNLGNGLFFNEKGKTSFDHKWYNLGMQDFLPTWRWWITNAADKVEGDLINADFIFDDAWFGGSCVKLHGQTASSRVRLFKTKFFVKSSDKISLTYKLLNGVESKAKLFVATKDNLTELKEIALPNAGQAGEWTTFTTDLSALGIANNDVIALMGISFENTPADYELLLGELSLLEDGKTFTPVKPAIKEVEILRAHYNAVDFKVLYQSKEEEGGQKTYNDEVDTWYFEIFYQQQGKEPQYLTATTSWAAYVIDAPTTVSDRSSRVGVRAVAPDGVTKSEIAWSEDYELVYTPLETCLISKPIIKAGEEFTISFEDTMREPAEKWEVKDPYTGAILGSAQNQKEVTLSIPTEGLYDLFVTANGKTTITRGFVQITPMETGAVPEILSLEASKTNPDANEAVTISYTSKKGEGSASRALRIMDPNMFRVPHQASPSKTYSYALWFKADKLLHDSDGTNLISKNTIKDKWPHNNWGDIWVQIRPEQKKNGQLLCNLNEISLNFMPWTAHNDPDLLSKDMSITEGVWNHLLITQSWAGTGSNQQMLFLNGKLVASTNQGTATRAEMSDGRIDKTVIADIYFGGPGVYKAGFDGWIDEVQIWNKALLTEQEVRRAMQGYKPEEVPDELLAYYTFEEKNADGSFPNNGKGGDELKGDVVYVKASGGENTSGASYEVTDAMNDELGYPGVPGSLDIKTSEPKWNLIGSETISSDANSITVKYASSGAYDAGVSIENRWGKGELVKAKYIKIGDVPEVEPEIPETPVTPVTGIEQILDEVVLSVYPNPFAEMLHLNFSKGGKYAIQISSLTGKVLSADLITVSDNENIQLRVDAEAGVYILQVKKDGKVYKTLKLVKK